MRQSKRFLAAALVAGVALFGAACEADTGGTDDPATGDTATEDTGDVPGATTETETESPTG